MNMGVEPFIVANRQEVMAVHVEGQFFICRWLFTERQFAEF